MMLVCLNRSSTTGQTIGVAGSFAVNILGEDQGELALRFATATSHERFAGVEVTSGPGGEPLLADALAHLECRVAEATTGGTHTVFLAEVEYASARGGGSPLAYFRGRFGRLAPHEREDDGPDLRDVQAARRAVSDHAERAAAIQPAAIDAAGEGAGT
jgi:flavin reductase (DIM6/NTAB) family NADH-FMN oxidoreductase RutF